MLLHEKLKAYRLILASHSPRRQQLLRDCGLDYTLADQYEVQERYPDDLPCEAVARYLSQLKSQSYPEPLAPKEILITADTVVLCRGRIIGKPADRQEAVTTLRSLSGRAHQVITGVTLRTASRCESFDASSDVFFAPLTDEQIAYYIDTFRPYDKAGAYGIQEWIGCVGIRRIEGSFYNVMGLPVQKLYTELTHFIES